MSAQRTEGGRPNRRPKPTGDRVASGERLGKRRGIGEERLRAAVGGGGSIPFHNRPLPPPSSTHQSEDEGGGEAHADADEAWLRFLAQKKREEEEAAAAAAEAAAKATAAAAAAARMEAAAAVAAAVVEAAKVEAARREAEREAEAAAREAAEAAAATTLQVRSRGRLATLELAKRRRQAATWQAAEAAQAALARAAAEARARYSARLLSTTCEEILCGVRRLRAELWPEEWPISGRSRADLGPTSRAELWPEEWPAAAAHGHQPLWLSERHIDSLPRSAETHWPPSGHQRRPSREFLEASDAVASACMPAGRCDVSVPPSHPTATPHTPHTPHTPEAVAPRRAALTPLLRPPSPLNLPPLPSYGDDARRGAVSGASRGPGGAAPGGAAPTQPSWVEAQPWDRRRGLQPSYPAAARRRSRRWSADDVPSAPSAMHAPSSGFHPPGWDAADQPGHTREPQAAAAVKLAGGVARAADADADGAADYDADGSAVGHTASSPGSCTDGDTGGFEQEATRLVDVAHHLQRGRRGGRSSDSYLDRHQRALGALGVGVHLLGCAEVLAESPQSWRRRPAAR